MNIGLLSVLEALRLLRRDPVKYARGVSGMYLVSVKGFELGRIARACFFFFRNIDDALDSDRRDIKNPLAHVLTCRNQIASGVYTGRPKIVNLAKFAIERLQRWAKPKDNPKQDFLDEIGIILFDHQRGRKRKVLNIKELKEYYKKTFFPVINLALIGLNSKLRATDIKELTFCQGIVYTIRDLEIDLQRGIINIPKEILKKAKLTANSSIDEVKSNPIIKNWFRKELLKCQKDLEILKEKLAAANESLTTKICLGLASPLSKLSRQFLSET